MSRGNSAQRAKVWRGVIRRQKTSGLSVAQFCRQEGLAQASFYKWRKKLASTNARSNNASSANASPFVELELPTFSHASPCEIVLAGCRVVVPPGFDADCLRQLLGVLGQGNPAC